MNKDKKIEILRDILKIRTINSNEEEVAIYLKELLKEYGIESEIVNYSPSRSSLVADLKKGQGRTLGISGHMDVVDIEDENKWTYPPFAAEIVDGKIYARGAVDMKAGLAALVIAMIEIKEEDLDFNGKIRLLATVGEEIGMYGSKDLYEKGYADELDGVLIAEPTSKKSAVYSQKGSILYEIIAHGRAAHSSMPEEGINALELLVDYINLANKEFEKIFSKGENKVLGKSLNAHTVINGGGQINSIPEKVVMKANARIVPEVPGEVFLKTVNDCIEKINSQSEGYLELNVIQDLPAVESAKDNDLIKAIEEVNKEVKAMPTTGATDAANFSRVGKKIDLAVYGPGEPSLAHTIDENLPVDEYLEYIEACKQIILKYLK